MDYNTVVASGGLSGILVLTGYITYKLFRHSRCKSNCCGKRMSLDVDLEETLLKKSNNGNTVENEVERGVENV